MESWRVRLTDVEGNFIYIGTYVGTFEDALTYAQELRKMLQSLEGRCSILFETMDGIASFFLH